MISRPNFDFGSVEFVRSEDKECDAGEETSKKFLKIWHLVVPCFQKLQRTNEKASIPTKVESNSNHHNCLCFCFRLANSVLAFELEMGSSLKKKNAECLK